VVHADDMTGQELVRALLAAVQTDPRIRILPHHLALELLLTSSGRCGGVGSLDTRAGRLVEFRAPVTLLATGGAGQVYLNTTNPPVTTGDGIAMAWRAGARVGNVEFVQFHPTVLHDPGGRSFLISEAVRGFGGVLIDHQGREFVRHPLGSLATRDIVARAIVEELSRSGRPCVYLDVTKKDGEATRRRFPNIYRHCLEAGIDMTRQPVPVVPAAHYMCGGVVTDLDGRTDLEGLYASGEVAMTGFHGANRLASNSLLEALVLAKRAFLHAAGASRPPVSAAATWEPPIATVADDTAVTEELRGRLRRVMWEQVGIVRSDRGLEQAGAEVAELVIEADLLYRNHAPALHLGELRNLAAVGRLVAHAAGQRRESRGGHYNQDHPTRDDARWGRPILLDRRTLDRT
jgi:L-aspartate oxidase